MAVYTLNKPSTPLPLVFDSPHSGTHYPDDFEFACDVRNLDRTSDKFVDELFSAAIDHGGTLLAANFPRCYVDVNRAADDIDPDVLACDWPYGDINPTARSDSGIGLIWRLARPGVPIYDGNLAPEHVRQRIERYYQPYHEALKNALDEAHYNFGQVYHINCHSMPASTATPKRARALSGYQDQPSDFVLGTRGGMSCGIHFSHALRDFLTGLGYRVTIDDPFRGVELVERYSVPSRGRHSLQIEINKALYMDEEACEKNENFDALQADVENLIVFCADYVRSQLTALAAD